MIKSLIAGVFGLFFAWNVWAGVGNFLGIQNQRLQLGLELTPVGWIVIFADVLVPIVVFALAVILARRKTRWVFTGALALGLLLVAVINLDLVLGVPVTAMFAPGAAG